MNTFLSTQPATQPRHDVLATFKNVYGIMARLADSLFGGADAGCDQRNDRAAEYDSQVLRQAVHANSPHEVDWLLTAALMTDAAKRRYCLERALTINPGCEPARRALEGCQA